MNMEQLQDWIVFPHVFPRMVYMSHNKGLCCTDIPFFTVTYTYMYIYIQGHKHPPGENVIHTYIHITYMYLIC